CASTAGNTFVTNFVSHGIHLQIFSDEHMLYSYSTIFSEKSNSFEEKNCWELPFHISSRKNLRIFPNN
ncbi:MAG: hypothetical protein MSH60_00995, partial [Ruminococcus sp.]|nr:hypothetical protein [Ruminococcus sp.]